MSTYVPIQAITLSATATEVNFTGIPQNFTDLALVTNSIGTGVYYYIRLNGDSSSLYSRTRLVGDGTTATSSRNSNQSEIIIDNLSSTNWGMSTIHIMNYSNTTTNKTVLARAGVSSNDVSAVVGLYRSASAITAVRLVSATNTFSSGTTFTLYGIGSGAPKAFGGDEVRTDGTYWYHIFRSSGRFEPVQALTCDYLVVAGGGGADSGGGGAGGVRCTVGSTGGGGSLESALSLSANTSYTVTVGAGGNAATTGNNNATSGSNSTFSTITSTGGGASRYTQNSLNGGSGGGAAAYQTNNTIKTKGNGTANQGYDGGAGGTSGTGGSGGGGAGAAGVQGGTNGGNGGNGITTSISGTSTVYGGGGGGGSNATGGTGGTGGGGNGANTNGTNGTANTGGGGGGIYGAYPCGNGGSGIVIVRYAV